MMHSALGRKKVKSGCRTCKIRKVKCDEGLPACRRCVSTGRVCDGYGIWGGGGNQYGSRQPCPKAPKTKAVVAKDPPLTPSMAVLVASADDLEYFDWFRCRTSVKLPGSFISGFWATLLLQASLSEPAILHAVLALSSTHQRQVCRHRLDMPPPKAEQVILQHYVSATRYLRSQRIDTESKASVRVALIACAVFISIDLLRGHISTAQTHLQYGLNLLQSLSPVPYRQEGRQKDTLDSIDYWILEAFSRLHLQTVIFGPIPSFCSELFIEPHSSQARFCSLKEAWDELDRLLRQILALSQKAYQHHTSPLPRALLQLQKEVHARLENWRDTYLWSAEILRGSGSIEEDKGCRILGVYHTMATIMVGSCVWPGDEGVFDSFTTEFVSLISELANLRSLGWTNSATNPPSEIIDRSRSIIDLGWIAPLYYVGVKCRIHRIRLQAVRLLESASHREGFWDAEVVARVARKVMEIEEADYYLNDLELSDDSFSLCSLPTVAELSLPPLPISSRIRNVDMVMSGNPLERVWLFGSQNHGGIDRRVCLATYDVQFQRWYTGENTACEERLSSDRWSTSFTP